MPGTAAGGTGSGRKRWGWAALMAGAFLAGLLLVGVILIRTPEAERSTADNLAELPAAIPTPSVASDNGSAGPAPGSRLAIVVDGLGYDPVRDAEWLDFPERITVSVLPYGPSSKSFAASARTHGFGVILHVPMESEGGVADRTEPFLLRRGMTPEEIADRFSRMADDVPQANGASNHMGSAFTSDLAAMTSFAQALKGKGFFFVDSVTS
ncbi:MAG TPA: divergent polysaccharide deacetylase family protein, partial [Candidatus Deferrimicrobium sp.]